MKYSKAVEIAKYNDEEIRKARIITNQIFPKYIKIILKTLYFRYFYNSLCYYLFLLRRFIFIFLL